MTKMVNSKDNTNQLFLKTDNEIIEILMQWWEMSTNVSKNGIIKLIGTYRKAKKLDKNGNEYGYFVNIRNPQGDLLYYPLRHGKVKVFAKHKNQYQDSTFLELEVTLSKKTFRERINNPFALSLKKVIGSISLEILDRVDKENFIKKIFNETGSTERDAKNTSNALKRIAGDLYTETERFIFELLQNADDIPNGNNKVDVLFKLLNENLLFLHNGKPFDQNDVNSIASIGDSTKRKNSKKTGYKGIGFKSVFADADTVLINSGNYSFSFDKFSPLYKGKDINSIPWEIKPIWTEHYRYPDEVKSCQDFFKYPIAIDLEVGKENILNYKKQIQNLFREPRFILFLRNIKSIEVTGIQEKIRIQKVFKSNRFGLLINGKTINEWIINDFDFSIDQATKDAIIDDKIVPEKLKEIQKSKLSFACQIKNNDIVRVPPEISFLFTYLPTNVNDYKFPFLVNADFLTTANRQSIHVNNIWNLYLFERIGELCFHWIKQIAQNPILKNTITEIIPKRFENSIEPIHQSFNIGFDKAIKKIAFLPTIHGGLCKASDALVDTTGLSEIIGTDLFIKIIKPKKILIDNSLKHKEKLKVIKEISFFCKDDVSSIFKNSVFTQTINPKLLLKILVFLHKEGYKLTSFPMLLSEESDKTLLAPSTLYFQTDYDNKSLITFKKIHYLHTVIDNYAKQDSEFKSWLISLGVKAFDGADFIRDVVINNQSEINNSIKNIQRNNQFWRFIFKYRFFLLENELRELSGFYIIETSKKKCLPVSKCYLSDHYKEKEEPSTEIIFKELGLNGYFLMSDYCVEQKEKNYWRTFFNKIGLKRAENIKIFKNELVPFIQKGGMNKNNYLKITEFIYDVYINNPFALNGIDLSGFKVRTAENYLKPILSCILSDDYKEQALLSKILPDYPLLNQIHSIYLQKISSNKQKFKDFFLNLNPNADISTIEIIKKKIKIIANNESSVNTSNIMRIWEQLLKFKDEILKSNREELKNIPILLKNGNLGKTSRSYFPNEYNPNTKIEDLLSGYYDYFISPKYSDISNLSYDDLKYFFKKLGVEEEIRRTFVGLSYFNVSHKEFLANYDFARKFWIYVQANSSLFSINDITEFKAYIQNNNCIPCLDRTTKKPNQVHSIELKDLVNDSSVTCSIALNENIETFLGLQQKLSVTKCFHLLNSIAMNNNSKDKRIKQVYNVLLDRFATEGTSDYTALVNDFQNKGKLLANNNTFQNVSDLFYQDTSAKYLPLDDTDKIVKRFGSKEEWNQFEETVLKVLGIQKISVSDFSINEQIIKYEVVELNLTLQNSLIEIAKIVDTVNYRDVFNELTFNLNKLQIYFSPNLKLNCVKLKYSPNVINYYDTLNNTIYYSGNWNSIANARLVEYIFQALGLSEKQISKEELVSILLQKIPLKYEIPATPPDIIPDGSTGRFGEKLVYNELIDMFGYERVIWLNEGGESYKEYDFQVLDHNNNILYYIDAKATTTDELSGDSIPIYIRKSEWAFMQKCSDNYIIARVYNAKAPGAYVKYLKLGLEEWDNTKH